LQLLLQSVVMETLRDVTRLTRTSIYRSNSLHTVWYDCELLWQHHSNIYGKQKTARRVLYIYSACRCVSKLKIANSWYTFRL